MSSAGKQLPDEAISRFPDPVPFPAWTLEDFQRRGGNVMPTEEPPIHTATALPTSRSGRGRKCARILIAIVVLSLFCTAVTEATGITRFIPTMIRIFTPV